MKKLFHYWLMAAMMLSLGNFITACSDDDDDDSKTPEEQAQEKVQQADKFWSVVGQLVSSSDYTEDYKDKTFQAVYGIPESEGSTVRIMNTNDMRTAVQRFNNLIEGNITEETSSYTWSDPDVGSLVYTKTNDGKSFAEVEVNIKQIRNLSKIIYREGGVGDNGYFPGKAYYRFGDVVSRRNQENREEFWVCVRPAFGPEKKEDSHWICVTALPQTNIEEITKNNSIYYVPKGLGKDKENMQNLAEMLYAIYNPHRWYADASSYHTDGRYWGFEGVPIFADFTKKNLDYHNEYFWDHVQRAWAAKNIPGVAFGVKVAELRDQVLNKGVQLLYHGYSWWSKLSWNCSLYEASYTNGDSNEEQNLHHAQYTTLEKNMSSLAFDCRTMGSDTVSYKGFFNNDGKLRWVIRHATGKELNGGVKLEATAPFQGGITEVYRYYDYYKDEWNRPDPTGNIGPEVSLPVGPLNAPEVGCLLGKDGKFYAQSSDCEANNTVPVAIVAYLGGNKRVEKGKDWNGLAIALKDCMNPSGTSYEIDWQEANSRHLYCTSFSETTDLTPRLLDGIAMTERLVNKQCNQNHNHIAATVAWNWGQRNYYNLDNATYSHWFLPSLGQWILAMEGLGEQWTGNGFNSNARLKAAFENAIPLNGHLTYTMPKGVYSTTTDKTYNVIYAIQFTNDGTVKLYDNNKGTTKVRPFIAFKYNGGGSVDPEAMPEQYVEMPAVPGMLMTSDGKFYATKAAADAKGKTVVALVVHADPDGDEVDTFDQNGKFYGLAIGLNDYEGPWCSEKAMSFAPQDEKYFTFHTSIKSQLPSMLNGINATSQLLKFTEDVKGNDKYPYDDPEFLAVKAQKDCILNVTLPDYGVLVNSGWFVPSIGQWILAFKNFGATWTDNGFSDGSAATAFEAIQKAFQDAGMADKKLKTTHDYFSATQDDSYMKVWTCGPKSGVSTALMYTQGVSQPLRCFVAFDVRQ